MIGIGKSSSGVSWTYSNNQPRTRTDESTAMTIKRLWCWIVGHSFSLMWVGNRGIETYGHCQRCGKAGTIVADNRKVNAADWLDE